MSHKNSIVIPLAGGLGNQLFQYAFARHIAMLSEAKLYIYKGNLKQQKKKREYQLAHFNIVENLMEEEEFLQYPTSRMQHIHHILKNSSFGLVQENYIGFDRKKLKPYTKNMLINGYWQSYKYFEDMREHLLCELTLKHSLSTAHLAIKEKIKNENSVSVHFRKDDYINDPVNFEKYYQCDQDYYTRAIERIENQIKAPHYFIFSDDLEEVKSNFMLPATIKKVSYISTGQTHVDLHLMSQCQHHIIANSTFSWWAAWLNGKFNKIVIAPKNWYKEDKQNDTIEDLIPKQWDKI